MYSEKGVVADPKLGRPMQVVKVIEGQNSYELDEDALREVLMREDIKDCPVVLVSVAGAYRGGKSFLLNLFLKYLNWEYVNCETGDWTAKENDPLEGFSWRGGSNRNTTGLHLYSHPILARMPNGQTVAVLLMDTQGTFDSSSTVRDCTTIFALSTMLASVQIYNITKNIQENDLQHLHLFIQYGEMALTEGGDKPFQKLKFLVRDWSWYTEHAYGAAGGKQLLDKRLEVLNTQAKELQEIRQKIKSCFEDVDCFLMPHPGSEVDEPNFDGQLKDLKDIFKKSLRELVPSIFSPKNLILKKLNGQPVKARELFHYFKTYMTIFNSDELPEPLTVANATAEGSLQSALSEMQQQYVEAMSAACGEAAPRSPLAGVRARHRDARDCALNGFQAKKKMGTQLQVDTYFERLKQDLESRLLHYERINEEKIQKAVSKAKQIYEDSLEEILIDGHVCTHPRDLDAAHQRAVAAAMGAFNENRILPEGDDTEKNDLQQVFTQRRSQLIKENELYNSAAVTKAREYYVTSMEKSCGKHPCIVVRQMHLKHTDILSKALKLFSSNRKPKNEYVDDTYITILKKDIDEYYSKFLTTNENNNKAAVEAAITLYNSIMTSTCKPDQPCLGPEKIKQEHKKAVKRALDEFSTKRSFESNKDEDDDYKRRICEDVEKRLSHYEMINEGKIQKAVSNAKQIYENWMQQVLVDGHVCMHPRDLDAMHERAVEDAISTFEKNRSSSNGENTEKNDLLQIFNQRLNQLKKQNELSNKAAVNEACGAYVAAMEKAFNHNESTDKAFELFFSKRDPDNRYTNDIYLSQLENHIEEQEKKFLALNEANKKSAVDAAISVYNSIMASICSPHLRSLHPDDLKQEHEQAWKRAISEFLAKIPAADDEDLKYDEFRQSLCETLSNRYKELCEINVRSNVESVNAAEQAYCREMETACGRGRTRLTEDALEAVHTQSVASALRLFNDRRRPGDYDDCDTYRNNLVEILKQKQSYYRVINDSNEPPVTRTERPEQVRVIVEENGNRDDSAGIIPQLIGEVLPWIIPPMPWNMGRRPRRRPRP